MNFLKLNCILGLYLVLLMKAVVATKAQSYHNSFIHIASWAVMCLKDDTILLGDDTASLGIGQDYRVLGTVDSCSWWLYMALKRSFETSGTDYPMTKHHITEDWNLRQHW